MIEPPVVTAEDIIMEEEEPEASRQHTEEPAEQSNAMAIADVKEIIKLGERLKFLIDQTATPNVSELKRGHTSNFLGNI